MNLIKKAIANGFPDKLLIPVAPPGVLYKRKEGEDANGKAIYEVSESKGKFPGVPYDDHHWGPCQWDIGTTDPVTRNIADENGCNVGLILGKPSEEHKGFGFVAVDIDLQEYGDSIPQTQLCDALERSIAAAYAAQTHEKQTKNYVCWTRKTHTYRAIILARVPIESSFGNKHRIRYKEVELDGQIKKIPLTKKDTPLQTIEFLTLGGYCVIAGGHHSGVQNRWYRSDVPDKFFDLPQITLDSVPSFRSFKDFVDVTEKAIDRVIDSQNSPMRLVKTKELKSTNIELFNSTYTVKAADLKPANAQLLLDLLEKLPNPDFVDRQSYETIMLAIAGCHWSLLELQELSIKDSQNIGIAAAQWASRWEGATKSDFETEHTKWQNDWSQRSPYRIGWRTLLNFASDIGMDLSPIKNSEAQTLFKADSDPKPQYSPLESSFGDNSEHIISDRSELTEFWLASQFLKKANNRIRYLPESKQWIANHPTKGGWFSQIANSWVNDQIQRFLHELSENMGKLSRDDINRLLRWSMVQRIENLCQDRVAITRDALNDAAWFLQTPAGAFDLRTGNKIPILQQQKNLDMRYTNYTPEKGATPMWDMLIDHLADDDKETAEWVKYYAAYSLIGDPCAQKMLFIHGNGGNGKSTLLQVLAGVMGSYAGSIDRDVWLERHTAKHPASLYLIRDLRLAYTSEMPDNEKWYEARLKAVTGQDPIEARVMSGNPVTFSAKAALLMVGNAIPNFHRVDSSIVRRVAIVGTTRAPKERIVKLGEKIIAREGAAILYDLMRRCQEMSQVEDYLPPTTARMNFETNEYLSQNDAGYAWVSSECISGSEAAGLITPLHVLLERFMAFNKRRNQGDVLSMMDSAAAFTEMLQVIKRVGARTKRPNGEEILWDGKPAAEGIGLKVRLAA